MILKFLNKSLLQLGTISKAEVSWVDWSLAGAINMN